MLIQQFFSNNQRYHLQHWSRDRAKLTDVCLLNYFDLVHLLVNLWELWITKWCKFYIRWTLFLQRPCETDHYDRHVAGIVFTIMKHCTYASTAQSTHITRRLYISFHNKPTFSVVKNKWHLEIIYRFNWSEFR